MSRHQLTHADASKGGKHRYLTAKVNSKLQKTLAELGLTSDILADVKDIAVELIKASQANPLVGCVVCMVTVNLLKRLMIIDENVELVLLAIIGTASAVDILGELEKDIPFIGLFTGGGGKESLIRPVPTTLTHAQTEGEAKKATDIGNKTVEAMITTVLSRLPAAAAA